MEQDAETVNRKALATKVLPCCHKRFAASTSKTGTTGEICGETLNTSLCALPEKFAESNQREESGQARTQSSS